MAVTQNTYTGDGTTVLFSFTFPYLETTDIKVSLNGTNTTAYTLANATTIQFNTAPANGAAIRIYRQTDDSALAATFYPGSAIRSADLNENFTQNLYVTQESTNNAATATSTANTALTNSNTAISTANTALSTANTASSNASAAVSTANTASSNASAAVSTANTASSNATTAVNTANAATATANSAASDAATALSTANAATSTANAASAAATNAVNTANAASSAASSAVSTANTASTNASNAVTTANTASSNATTAVNTANSAVATANSAAAAVANAVIYTIVANVAAIPASPSNNTAIEVANSTGIESFTPLAGKPAGFTGNSGLSVRILYSTAGSTWNWVQYFPNDPEARYLKLAGGTLTGALLADDSTSVASPVIAFDGDANTGIAHTGADELALVTGGTARVTVDPSGAVAVTNSLSVGGQAAVVTNDARLSDTRTPTDGSVTNAKVSASAAIAGSKISPDFGAQNVTTTGTSTAASFIPTSSTVPTNGLYLPSAGSVAISTGGSETVNISPNGVINQGIVFSNRYSTVPTFSLRRAQGTQSSPTVVEAGGYICGLLSGNAYDGSAYQSLGGIRFVSDGAISNTSSPGYITFSTTPSGSTANTERLRITSAGLVGVGTSTPFTVFNSYKTITGGNPATSGTTDDNVIARIQGGSVGLDIGGTASGLQWIQPRSVNSFATNYGLAICPNGGNVGIGTSVPDQRLVVAGNITVGDNSSSGYSHLYFLSGTSGSARYGRISKNYDSPFDLRITASNSAGAAPICFDTYSGNEVARFDTSGRLGIGTTSPQVPLDVSAAGNAGAATDASLRAYAANRTAYLSIGYDGLNASTNSGGLKFFFNDTERARIDSSGRLLVGTSSALTGSTAQYSKNVNLGNSANSAGNAVLAIGRGAAATSISPGNTIGSIYFTDNGAGEFASIDCFADAAPGTNDYPGRLVFSTCPDGSASPVERVRISSAGTLSALNGDAGIRTISTAGAGTSVTIFRGSHSGYGFSGLGVGTECIYIWSNGNVQNTNNSYGAISDAKLKENIVDAGSQWDDLKALQVRKYNFKEESGQQTHTQIGLVAQEVELVSPGLVSETPDRDEDGNDLGTVTKSVNYSVLYMKAVKALQEAIERIETLEAKVSALESA